MGSEHDRRLCVLHHSRGNIENILKLFLAFALCQIHLQKCSNIHDLLELQRLDLVLLPELSGKQVIVKMY